MIITTHRSFLTKMFKLWCEKSGKTVALKVHINLKKLNLVEKHKTNSVFIFDWKLWAWWHNLDLAKMWTQQNQSPPEMEDSS